MSAKRTIFPHRTPEKQPTSGTGGTGRSGPEDFEEMYTGHPGVEPSVFEPEEGAPGAPAHNTAKKGHAAYAAHESRPGRESAPGSRESAPEAPASGAAEPGDNAFTSPMGEMPPFEPRQRGRGLGGFFGGGREQPEEPSGPGDLLSIIPPDVLERECRARVCPDCPTKKEADEARLRALAELDNAKKRMEREHAEQARFAAEAVLSDILPSLDNLDLALQHASASEACKDFVTGVRMTRKLLDEALAKHGLQAVGEKGEEFNPALHEAVGMQSDKDVPDNHVCALLSRGYTLNGRLLRPARVMVCRK